MAVGSTWPRLGLAWLVLLGHVGSSLGDTRAETPEPGHVLVRQEANGLSIDAVDAPLGALLLRIGEETGATVDLAGLQDRDVSLRVVRRPVEDALNRLLGDQNYVARYSTVRDAEGNVVGSKLASLRVLGPGGTAPAESPSPNLEGTQTTAAQSAIRRYGALLHRNREVSLSDGDALADVLGTSRPSLTQVFGAAFGHEDAVVRRDAARALGRAFSADDGLPDLASDDRAARDMATALRAVAGQRAEEFLRAMSSGLDDARLRAQADAILAALER